jgi:acetyl-CoA carboxylase biotin carboxyl carrier protein
LLDIDKIQQLIQMMVENDLVEISLRSGGEEVNLRRPSAAIPAYAQPTPTAQPDARNAGTDPRPPAQEEPAGVELLPIVSPMVGTFYTAADAESPPFVQVGSVIQPGTVVCILEAMKVFNEIKAEIAGIIERILAKNEQAVEYGQPLFLVRPA